MKRIFKRILIILPIVFILVYTALYFWIEQSVKDRISLAKAMYGGNAEEALISYMRDEFVPPDERTHNAIWTLGQIRSEQALPYLKAWYNGDRKGETCHGHHNTMICQYELYKAISLIERKWLPAHRHLIK